MLLTTLLCTTVMLAPPLGGEMNHATIELGFDNVFELDVERPGFMLMSDPGAGFTGVEGVLNGNVFNAQYGWLIGGFWSPPFGTTVWIEALSQDERLSVYLGRPIGGTPYFSPIFGTDGSSPRIAWDGSMLHNYYAAPTLGVFEAAYRVYIGDGSGNPIAGYTDDTIEFAWMHGRFDRDENGAFDLGDAYAQHQDPGDVDADGDIDPWDTRTLMDEVRRAEGDERAGAREFRRNYYTGEP